MKNPVSLIDYSELPKDKLPVLRLEVELAIEFRRRQGSRRHTLLVALTASAMESDRRRCLAAGMDDYVAKPVDTRTLVTVIDRWCGGDRSRG